jgi:hypothetical protein
MKAPNNGPNQYSVREGSEFVSSETRRRCKQGKKHGANEEEKKTHQW